MESVSSPQPQRLFVNDTLSLKLHKVSIVGTKDLIKRVKITPPTPPSWKEENLMKIVDSVA